MAERTDSRFVRTGRPVWWEGLIVNDFQGKDDFENQMEALLRKYIDALRAHLPDNDDFEMLSITVRTRRMKREGEAISDPQIGTGHCTRCGKEVRINAVICVDCPGWPDDELGDDTDSE